MSLLDVPPNSLDRIQSYISFLKETKNTQEKNKEKLNQELSELSKTKNLKIKNELEKQNLDLKTKNEESILKNQIFVPEEPNFLIVILLRSKIGMSAKLKKVCDLFRLEKINTAVLIKNNESTRNMLHLIKDYTAYGYLKYDTLRELLKKRGKGRFFEKHFHSIKISNLKKDILNEHNIFISDYELIRREKIRRKNPMFLNLTPFNIYNTFKNKEIINIDDICYHLFTNSEYFKIINNFLAPFRLNCPKNGFKRNKRRNFVDNGILGNWHYEIEGLILRMLD